QAIQVHYQSRNQQQLVDFIENVVLQEQDTMMIARKAFVDAILFNTNKQTASSRIVEFLEKELFVKESN
ncbi:MAG: CDP-glycerol--glycerophosphate glycerophosphotransferase, partial [Flavobacterium sp.]|nr:CDP-glycerol--glycerophosphate glycerophosphotransferase [Flavobacterium sp.]